jgi:hypothetical protein
MESSKPLMHHQLAIYGILRRFSSILNRRFNHLRLLRRFLGVLTYARINGLASTQLAQKRPKAPQGAVEHRLREEKNVHSYQ